VSAAYIAATGIAEMKDALKEKEADQSLKAKTRERVQPKMGKIDIDYQKLHDAFFRFQTKPESLTRYGETYYEGKEFETKFKERRPGDLSEDLKEALSIPPLAPPPWLIAMQRFGPPPSYPHLKIAGLNAPIPEGAQWGFHPGGWGRPPMDEFGRPIYAEVMGTDESAAAQAQQEALGEPINREPWGELEPEEEEEEEDDEEEEEEQDEEEQDDGPADGLETPLPSGLETPGGFQSVTSTVPGGLETPDFLELRKGARGAPSTRAGTAETEDRGPRSLYHVVPEMQRQGGSGFMPSDRGYDLSGIARQGAPVLGEERGVKVSCPTSCCPVALCLTSSLLTLPQRKQGDVDLALAPEELESLSKEELAARYDAARAKKDRFKF
jgi:splicing factor 3B subunit 2